MRRIVPRVALVVAAIAGTVVSGAVAGNQASAATPDHVAGLARHVDPLLRAHHSGRTNNQQSENWSGYIKPGASGGYTNSTATWTVPTLKTDDDGYSSTWVGIDGATSDDQYLIQTGTEADVIDGQPSYDAWWEVITPTDVAPETIFDQLSVSPGDSITAAVAQGSDGNWSMSIADKTNGQNASHTSSFSGPGESAEWIQEDTDVDGNISAAPDWQSVDFSGITVNGANPALTADEAVDIVDSQGTQEDSTGAPNDSGDGFTVTWLAPGTETPTG